LCDNDDDNDDDDDDGNNNSLFQKMGILKIQRITDLLFAHSIQTYDIYYKQVYAKIYG